MKNKNYFLNEKYVSRSIPAQYFIHDKKIASIYQVAVYKFAQSIIEKKKIKSVLDVGCGYGEKLKKYIYPFCKDITGVDAADFIEVCKKVNNFGTFIIDNIEHPGRKFNKKFDLIVSADVIEHLINPDRLLEYIKKHSHENTLVIISTPERDLLKQTNKLGPPDNTFHVKEWNREEFNKYISFNGFSIIKHILLEDFKKSLFRRLITVLKGKKNKTCQTILCTPSKSQKKLLGS